MIAIQRRRLAMIVTFLIGGLSVGGRPPRAQSIESPLVSPADCGVVALYLLLHAEGHRTSLRALESHLHPPASDGHSMKDLRDGARAVGLNVQAIALARDVQSIDRPMIVFLRGGRVGHFVFVRPVGHTGKLVQVIDPNLPTAVMNKANLVALPGWTGVALVPVDDQRFWWGGSAVLGAVALAITLKRRSVGPTIVSE